MSLLALLTGTSPETPTPTPEPPPGADAQPMRLLTLAQTVDAPTVERATTTAALTDPALVPGQTFPAASLRLIGTNKALDVVYRYEAHSYEWMTDAAECALRIKASGATDNMRAYRIYVDGSPATPDYVRQETDAQVKVPLGPAGTWRTVRVDLSMVTLDGVDVPTGARVQATGARKRLYVLGDSWTSGASYRPRPGGTGTENGPGIEHMAFLTARLLDAELYLGGMGGTGYGNGAANGRHYAAQARLDRLVASRPDAVLVFGSINDTNTDGSGIGQYASQVYQRIATDLPGVPVLVCGVQDWGGTNKTPVSDSSPEVTRAVAAAPNVKGYVQPVVEDWVTDANVAMINNAQYNNAHLTVYGNRFYAEKLAAFIARSLNIPSA